MGLDSGDIKIDITSDRMEARITLLSEEVSDSIDIEALKEALAKEGVTHGLDEERLRAIAAKPIIKVPQLVARGTEAVDGESEKIEYKFPIEDSAKVTETEAGSVDFRSVSNFNNTPAETLLAVKSPATEGSPGFTVTGDELKARDGKAVNIRVGKGAVLAEDGLSASAEVDGHACLVADRVSVLQVVEVQSDVDYSVGNIKFIGGVRIRGGVMPGFSVEAQGDIEIGGSVEKAKIVCGGNLDIRGIVFGQGDCLIEVGGDANIGAIDQAELKVRGDLHVNSYIRHSKVAVGSTIEVSGKKGTIVGGDIHAFQCITSPFIGNPMATLTKLTVGTNPFISHVVESLQAQHDELDAKLTQVRNAHKSLTGKGAGDDKSQAMLQKLEAARAQLEPQVAKIKQQLEEAKQQVTELREAKIRVSEIIYPGVVISFRDRIQYKTQDELQHVSFYEEEAEIRTGPL